MRAIRAFRAAIIGTVLFGPHFAAAQGASPDVVVRFEALDKAPPRLKVLSIQEQLRNQARWFGLPAVTPIRPHRPPMATPQPVSLPPLLPAEPEFDLGGEVVPGLQCVPFARDVSGIAIHGDAWTWWDKAAGIYARGNHPEPGAVLSFPGIERMPLGHVAVVTDVLDSRKILIDHANWPNAVVRHGLISHGILAVDVSEANDWSEVRVQFGKGGPLGSVYPANGFIYGWTETGVQIARPKFAANNALWSPAAPGLRMLNTISYLWVLPKAAREKAYAEAARGLPPVRPAVVPVAHAGTGRLPLIYGPGTMGLTGSALGSPLGVNRLDVGPSGKIPNLAGHFVLR